MSGISALVRSQELVQDYVPAKRKIGTAEESYAGFPAGTDFTAQGDLLKELLIGGAYAKQSLAQSLRSQLETPNVSQDTLLASMTSRLAAYDFEDMLAQHMANLESENRPLKAEAEARIRENIAYRGRDPERLAQALTEKLNLLKSHVN